MNEPFYYCKSWFRAKKRPTERWTLEQAKVAHESGRLYTVLVGSAERPNCFLEVGKDFVGVGFLDAQLRESLSYQFQQIEPGRLFLSMATYREFLGQSDNLSEGTTYFFSREGIVKIERERFQPHEKETSERSVDVLPNYSDIPIFGEYEDLIRIER